MRALVAIRGQWRVLRWIVGHPLSQGRRTAVLMRWLRWHVGSRLVPGPVAVPFAGSTRMLVRPGMTGATPNLYVGLAELSEMGLVAHVLRPGDLFVDVGANIGSYTLLAGGVARARVLAVEPISRTFAALGDNLRLNGLNTLVDARRVGVGRRSGRVVFSAASDTTNHVLRPGEWAAVSEEVEVCTLDSLVADEEPCVIKMDVEGFEGEVLSGATTVLASAGLRVLIVELTGHGARYGQDEAAIATRLAELGFRPHDYDPFHRVLAPLPVPRAKGNTIFVRDTDWVMARVLSAPAFSVAGWNL